jgi:hypothetical protein
VTDSKAAEKYDEMRALAPRSPTEPMVVILKEVVIVLRALAGLVFGRKPRPITSTRDKPVRD